MKKIIMAAIALAIGMSAGAVDYSSLNGLSGAALKQEVKRLALPHDVISYGDDSWDVFAVSDVQTIEGKAAWFDMYSNRLVYVESGHGGMNIEHAVANSWWGGLKNDAYKDLHHLNPSDADANNRKNDNPLGIIAGLPTWSNGVTNIGAPAAGLGGGSKSVFEPAEEFKGDFARAYFYVFTVYDDIAWKTEPACMYDLTSYPTLKPWAYEMLMEWAAADPVDSREAARNKSVAAYQKNENPYVAIPGLADYVWGSKKDRPFNYEDAMKTPVADRPVVPVFDMEADLVGINTWAGRWWDAFDLELTAAPGVDIYYTLTDTDEYELYDGPIEIGSAGSLGRTITVKTFASTEFEGKPLRSRVATLTLSSFNSESTDYQNAEWEKVTSEDQINEEELYIVVSSKANNVMGCATGSSSSSAYLAAAGVVEPQDGVITKIPQEAALVKLLSDGGTLYYVGINDINMERKGYLATNVAKKLTVSEEGRAAALSVTTAGNVKVDFGSESGTLQYNAQQPRFSCYTSSQQAVDLYRYKKPTTSIVNAIDVPSGGKDRIFNLQGVEVTGAENLAPGIYVRVKASGKAEKIIM